MVNETKIVFVSFLYFRLSKSAPKTLEHEQCVPSALPHVFTSDGSFLRGMKVPFGWLLFELVYA